MERFAKEEQTEVTLDYMNLPEASARINTRRRPGQDTGSTATVPGETDKLESNPGQETLLK